MLRMKLLIDISSLVDDSDYSYGFSIRIRDIEDTIMIHGQDPKISAFPGLPFEKSVFFREKRESFYGRFQAF